MITSIAIQGLGPTEADVIECDPRGLTVVSGESECGKSTIMEAICLCLWGQASDGSPYPVEAIRDGYPAAVVEVTTAKGSVFKRSISTSRAVAREATKNGSTERPTREEDWRRLLGPLGDDVLGRLILVPLAWQSLAAGPGGGRPLRDLLARLLPPQDLRAIVAEMAEIHDGDSLDEKGVATQRADERRHVDECRGRLAHLREESTSAERAVPVGPSEAEVAEARSGLDHAKRWAAYRSDLASHEARSESAAKMAAAGEAWDRRLAELGAEPAVMPEPSDREAIAAEKARERAEREDEARQKAVRVAEAALTKASAGTCPTCGQTMPANRVTAAQQALDEATRAQSDSARALVEASEARAAAVRAYGEAKNAAAARSAWLAARKRLADRPVAPDVGDPPAPPSGDEPSPERVAAWRAVLVDVERSAGAAAEQDRRRARVASQLADAERDVAEGEAELLRLERLLAAVRRAPSEAARRQSECLGDLGPVSIQWPEGPKADAIRVLLDGRPWWCASTGRQIVGDVYLRAAIRRLARWPWMPIVVDRVQDVAGQEIPAVRPAIWLRTCEGPMTVEVMP